MNDKDLKELSELVDKLERKMKNMGLVDIAKGAEHRRCSRAAIYELISRGRINAVDILDTKYVSTYEMDEKVTRRLPLPAM